MRALRALSALEVGSYLMDLMAPMLINPDKLSELRVGALEEVRYEPVSVKDGHRI